MKYMKNGSFNSKPLMRITLIASLIFLIGFWITSAMMYFSRMNLTPDSVIAYYRGSETAFTQARTFGSMLEVTHGHLPVMALVALLLTHLFVFTSYSGRIKLATIIVFFGAALTGEAASWLVRFVHPAFAWLKIVSFLALEISMAFVIVELFRMLMSTGRTSQAQKKSNRRKKSEKQTA